MPHAGPTALKGNPALADLVSSYAARRPGWTGVEGHVKVIDDETVVAGRPGIRDVVADVGGTLVHLPVGLRVPGEETRVLAGVEEPVLGLHDDPEGLAVAFDAVRDADTAALLTQAVTGRTIDPERVRQVRFDTSSATLAFDDRLDFTIFDRLVDGPHPGLELLIGLDSVGFQPRRPAGGRLAQGRARPRRSTGASRRRVLRVGDGAHLGARSLRRARPG